MILRISGIIITVLFKNVLLSEQTLENKSKTEDNLNTHETGACQTQGSHLEGLVKIALEPCCCPPSFRLFISHLYEEESFHFFSYFSSELLGMGLRRKRRWRRWC